MPTETWAACRRPGSSSPISTTSPDEVTIRTRRTPDEKLPSRRPEPCVAVETAPAICWATMSPWFASARPSAQSGTPNSPIVVAGPTTTRRRLASIERMPPSPRRSSSSPSVATTGVNECPAPATRTGSPRRAASVTRVATSSSLAGAACSSGLKDWLPTQLVQVLTLTSSTKRMADDGTVYVRYLVDDVGAATDFYVTHLGFERVWSAGAAFAEIARGNLHLLLSGPTSSAARPMPDGRQPAPGGWNRFVIEVDDITARVAALKEAGAILRNEI